MRPRIAAAGLVGAAALAWAAGTFNVSNDHFGRIAPARQIARYHELPFRDFFDPGYFLTELSSAALQRLLGDNLLGELLLTSAFIATGTAIVFLLAHRVTRSTVVALVAAVLALFAVPRPYDYDKVLFYPLGLLVACRYAERSSRGRALALAAVAVTGALFRYDTGVYVAVAAAAALLAQYGRDWRSLLRSAVRLAVVTAALTAPVLMAIQVQIGLGDAIDQAWTYGTRERARTEITRWPPLTIGPLAGLAPPPPPTRIAIRWAPSVDESARPMIEARLGLRDGELTTRPEMRTWSYAITDTSRDGLRHIVTDPAVEDTSGIERGALVLSEPESWSSRAQREWPLLRARIFPELWQQPANAPALLYYLCWSLPLVAAALLLTRRSRQAADGAHVCLWGAITLCLVTSALVLRDPVEARIGGVAGAPAVLAAWIATRTWQASRAGGLADARSAVRRRVARGLTLVLIGGAVMTIVWSLSVAGDWRRRVVPQVSSLQSLTGNLTVAAMSPPPESQLPTGGLAGLVRYVRECTADDDRVFASWFVPELYVFAQRGFAGGMTVVFGNHWSEPRFQRRSVALFQSQRVPVVIIEERSRDSFVAAYPLLQRFFEERYRLAGIRDFGNLEVPGGYRVLVDAARVPTRVDAGTGLPCFR